MPGRLKICGLATNYGPRRCMVLSVFFMAKPAAIPLFKLFLYTVPAMQSCTLVLVLSTSGMQMHNNEQVGVSNHSSLIYDNCAVLFPWFLLTSGMLARNQR